LVAVKKDAGAVIASRTYADSNARLIPQEGGTHTYFDWAAMESSPTRRRTAR
jgi:hypothetical protein